MSASRAGFRRITPTGDEHYQRTCYCSLCCTCRTSRFRPLTTEAPDFGDNPKGEVMTEVSTEQKVDRRAEWTACRTLAKDLLATGIALGRKLNLLRPTYEKADQFYAAALTQVGLSKSTVNRLQVAAKVADESPKVAQKVTSYDSVAAFNRYDDEQRTAILAEVGSKPDPATVKAVGARLFPEDPEKVAAREQGQAEKDAKRVAALVSKHRASILNALDRLQDEDLSTALIVGAKLAAKIGAGEAPRVIAQVIAERKSETDEDETDEPSSDD